MLESSVELFGVLSLGVLPLLIAICIVGSVLAALRAVSRSSDCVSKEEPREVSASWLK